MEIHNFQLLKSTKNGYLATVDHVSKNWYGKKRVETKQIFYYRSAITISSPWRYIDSGEDIQDWKIRGLIAYYEFINGPMEEKAPESVS